MPTNKAKITKIRVASDPWLSCLTIFVFLPCFKVRAY